MAPGSAVAVAGWPARALVHPLGSHALHVQRVTETGVVAVEQLQQQVIGHVPGMHAQLVGQALRELRGSLADVCVQFAQPAHQGRVRVEHVEHGKALRVELRATVGMHRADARQRQSHPGLRQFGGREHACAHVQELHAARPGAEGIDVAQLGVEHAVAGAGGRLGLEAHILGLRHAGGQREQQFLPGMRGLEAQRRGHRPHARQVEGQSVGPHTPGMQQLQAAAFQRRGVDGQRREPPEQASQGFAAQVGLLLQIALLLLEQLRAQEKALAPADLVEPHHGDCVRGLSRRPRCAARACAARCVRAAPGPATRRRTSAG